MLTVHPDDGIVIPIQAIILDLDGTLIEHDEDYKRACVMSVISYSGEEKWQSIEADFKPKSLPRKLKKVYEHGLHSAEAYMDKKPPEIAQLYLARCEMSLDYIKPNEELREALLCAKESGIKLFVMTHSQEVMALKALKKAGLDDVFEKGDVNNAGRKESSETFESYLNDKVSDINPKNVALFDDAKNNVAAAEKAGLTAVHVEKDDDESLAKLINDIVIYNEAYVFEAQVDLLNRPIEP